MNKTDTARKIQGDNGDREENDFYPTPERATEELLKRININGVTWECACGDGAISKLLPGEIISTDLIDRGYGEPYVDFLKTIKKVDWIITNPPYSKMRKFIQHSMKVADNIVFLATINHLWLKARLRDIEEDKFGIKEIIIFDTPKNFPQAGFQIGCFYLKKDYNGDIKYSKLKLTDKEQQKLHTTHKK